MLKVNIYIETDGNDKRNRYRTYMAIVEFKLQNGEAITRETCGTENTSGDGIILAALTSALSILTKPCKVTVYINDEYRYVTETIRQGRMYTWLSNGWHTIQGKPIKNHEEWEKIIRFVERHELIFAVKSTHEYKKRMQYDIKKIKGQGIDWHQQKITGGDIVEKN